MSCQNCVAHVKKAVSAVAGVDSVEVDLESGIARIQGHPDEAELIAAIEEEGYEASRSE